MSTQQNIQHTVKKESGMGDLMQGDARHIPLQDNSVQCVVTSPP